MSGKRGSVLRVRLELQCIVALPTPKVRAMMDAIRALLAQQGRCGKDLG